MYLRREKATVPLDEQGQVPVLDQRIEDFVDMDAFRDLTASLNERQRKVVSLKILGDLTHREIAQLLSPHRHGSVALRHLHQAAAPGADRPGRGGAGLRVRLRL